MYIKRKDMIDDECAGLQFTANWSPGTELCVKPPEEAVGEAGRGVSTEPIIVRWLSGH